MNIKKNRSLKPYNTLGIDVNASHFLSLDNINDLQTLLTDKQYHHLPKLILGGGSNVLFTKNYSGLVIKNELKGLDVLDENNDHIWLKVASGENWHSLVIHCVEQGYGGIENLSLIPGTVGAAPMQNIGAYGVEIRSVFESLEAIELTTGEPKRFNHNDCQFDYRNSVFKHIYKNQFIITNVTLKLNKKPKLNTHYGAIQATLKEMNAEPSVKNISDAVIHIRQKKLPDPKKIPNAGSFFKNPIITTEAFHLLRAHHPEAPHYPTANDKIKIPAAWLIEQCGWKGKTVGKAGVHQHQALVIINHDHASGASLKKLAEAIQQSVEEEFDIILTPEVNIL